MTDVRLSRICKSYRKNAPVLNAVSLEIHKGELFFLLGPSGCGKSTLLRILAGLLTPDSGSIYFNDEDVTGAPPEKRHAPMVFQSYALWPHLTVFENVAFGLRAEGISRDKIREEVAQALEIVRLADCADRKIPSLSGGQQQRVALARALAVHPDVLLLDEPLSNLDARLRDEMREEIRRIVKSRGVTAIYVTHDRREALSMADRIAVLSQGNLRQAGTPENVYNHPADKFTASFLGDCNFLDGVARRNGEKLWAETKLGNFVTAEKGNRFRDGESVTLMFRPECVHFVPQGEKSENMFSAELQDGIFLGDHREWNCRAGEIPVFVHESAADNRSTGFCQLAVEPERLILLKREI